MERARPGALGPAGSASAVTGQEPRAGPSDAQRFMGRGCGSGGALLSGLSPSTPRLRFSGPRPRAQWGRGATCTRGRRCCPDEERDSHDGKNRFAIWEGSPGFSCSGS
ncbi:hypothetical protein Nmel_016192 [Mimus melanotis]